MTTESHNKRIAKNTLYLYFRMIFTLFVGLFTSRVVLNALGVHDYGLNNVVAGVISLLGYVNGLLNQGTSRFLTIGLGKGDMPKLKKLFTACYSLHLLISLFTLILGETLGVWFVNTQLVIDPNRLFAANVVFQLALFSSIVSFIQAPFQASIISHEKMGVFAYMSIYDVCMKLLLTVVLVYIDTDKLILYSVFYFCVNLSSVFIYNWYCRKHFAECSLKIGMDMQTYKEIGSYIGWNAIGTFAYLANAQGFNILLNRFFSTVVNAARGIASYISGVLAQFVSNFQTASRPQITKYYAQGKYKEMNDLIINTSKYSSFILIIMGVPTFLESEYLVKLWLGQVPEYVVPFIQLTILQQLIIYIDGPLSIGIRAIGKMRTLNIFSVINYLSFIVLWYIALKFGVNPVTVYMLSILIYPVIFAFDIYLLHSYSGIDVKRIVYDVLVRSLLITMVSAIIPYFIHISISNDALRLLLVCISSIISSSVIIYYCGLDKYVRKKICEYIRSRLQFRNCHL